jgi:acetyl-CoA C-acetyltransferase
MSVYILAGSRTPSGSFLGSLSSVPAPKLGAVAIKGALDKAQIEPSSVNEVIMGQVISAGVGQAPARQAALFAGLPKEVMATTVNKVCGSGMKAVIMASQSIALADSELIIAGGMENMSLAPHLLPNSRTGFKFGETALKDSMQWDGLWDVYSNRAMGNCAEECAVKYKITREEQDQFAISSFKRAQTAILEKKFEREISPVIIPSKTGDIIVSQDEGPMKANFEKMPKLNPAFEKNGTITAANASTINDGACALVLGSEKFKDKAKFKIVSYAGAAMDPTWFTLAPIEATKKVLQKSGLKLSDIGVFEINEAFSLVPLVMMKELKLSHDQVNLHGGGVSLGHPIGCSGARIILSLMSVMEEKSTRYGLATICIGGGEALSLIVEKL